MRTLDPHKHALQRHAIVEAATRCFARHGFHQTSTQAICTEAETSSGKLFHYFPSKKSIIVAVVDDQAHRHRAWMAALQQETGTVALAAFLDGIVAAAGDPDTRAMALETAAEAGRDADVAAICTADDRMFAEGLTALLARACAQEELQPTLGLDQIAGVLMALTDGLFSRASADPDVDPGKQRPALQIVLNALLGKAAGDRHE